MEKINRSLALCGVVAAFGLGSCLTTTNELDLDKEISLDMQIGPGGLSIPLGSLDTLFLDSLIKVDGDDSMLKKLDDGTFGITMDGTVDSVKVKIDPLDINIDPPTIGEITTSFATPKKEDLTFNIPTMDSESELKVGTVDLSDMQDNFDPISLEVTTQSFPVGIKGYKVNNLDIPVPKQTQGISFNFTLPDEVERLNSITFGEQGTKNGQKICLNVDLGGIYSTLDDPVIRIKQLSISFPDNFVLAKDDQLSNYIKQGTITASGNVFTITMNENQKIETFTGTSKVLPLSFYLVSGDFSGSGHTIDFDGEISYSLDLVVSGTSKGTGSLYVDVKLNDQLKIADFSVDTRAKVIPVLKDTIKSSFQIKGLGGMKKINTIDFEEDESYIRLAMSDFDIDPFQFDDQSSIRLVFSDDFVFDKTYSLEDRASWTSDADHDNILVIDPTKAKGKDVVLHLSKVKLYQEVDKLTGAITMNNNVAYSTAITIASKDGLDSDGLAKMKDQTVGFTVSGAIVIKDADFTIAEIRSELSSSTSIDVVEDNIDESLVALSRIDIDENNPAGVTMSLKFDGVPDEIDSLTISDLTISLPDFIKMEYVGQDPNIYIDEFSGAIVINRTVVKSELASGGDGLILSGFNIKGLEFKEPLVLVNGRLELLDQRVEISGAATVAEQNLGLAGLDMITVQPAVEFNPIRVKAAYGKVNPQIDEVHEMVELSLGEDNDFFQNDKNTLSLSDPQIVINLTSSVTLPIDMDLSLSSYDSKGEYIARNIGPENGTIHLPKCDYDTDKRTTTLVIYKNERDVPVSDDTIYVRISRLSELMTTIPDKIEFNLRAGVNQDEYHFVDLTRTLFVCGSYDVSIPLAFDSLYIEYSDTIKDLSKDLEDIADKIDATEVRIMADIESTIPLSVKLVATAYDKRGYEMPDIVIDSCVIAAGSDTISKSQINLNVDIKNGKRLADLESIVFTAACENGSESSSIRDEQWLWIKKVRMVLPEGLKVDLTENKNKK